MSNDDKNYSPSASFVAVSFFAAITISVLCGNIYKLVEGVDLCKIFSAIINCNFESINTIYAISLLIFLIKYFLDDIIGDINRNDNITSPFKLVVLGLGWTFFMLAATFVSEKGVVLSALFWLIGLVFITIVLCIDICKNRKDKKQVVYNIQGFISGEKTSEKKNHFKAKITGIIQNIKDNKDWFLTGQLSSKENDDREDNSCKFESRISIEKITKSKTSQFCCYIIQNVLLIFFLCLICFNSCEKDILIIIYFAFLFFNLLFLGITFLRTIKRCEKLFYLCNK